MEQIRQIKEANKENLFSMANVVAVSVGFKYVGGERTNELSVVVDVSTKVDIGSLSPEDIIPTTIDGVKTDVIESGLITAQYDPTQKFRPAPGGVSIGHKDITAGTLAIAVPKHTPFQPESGESFASMFGSTLSWPVPEEESSYILSNNHVLAKGNEANLGDSIYQPGPIDGGTSDDIIALLSHFIPIKYDGTPNKVDCALAKPIDSTYVANKEILVIGGVSGSREAQLGMIVCKYGRTTEYNEGMIVQVHASVMVGGFPGGQSALFEDQFITELMSSGGDSGSLAVEKGSQKAVGLLFAGSNTATVFNCILNVEEALDIKL